MQKTIALFLAMIMILSAIPLAFAENETTTNESVEDAEDTVVVISGDNESETEVETETEDETEEVEIENETEAPEVELPEEVLEEAGVTPDSPLYGLERAMERISLALTLGKSAKAKKGLAHARERLMEVQAMIAAKKLDKAAKAQEGYEDSVEEVNENVEEMGDGDGEQELADQVEIEQIMEENSEVLDATNQIRLKVSKSLGAEEKARLESVIGSLEGVTSQFSIKLQANKNKTKIKIKAEKGATDEEIAALENALKEGKDLAQVRIVKKGTGVIKQKGKEKSESAETEDTNESEEDLEDENKTGSSKGKNNKGKDKSSEDEEETEVEIEVENEED